MPFSSTDAKVPVFIDIPVPMASFFTNKDFDLVSTEVYKGVPDSKFSVTRQLYHVLPDDREMPVHDSHWKRLQETWSSSRAPDGKLHYAQVHTLRCKLPEAGDYVYRITVREIAKDQEILARCRGDKARLTDELERSETCRVEHPFMVASNDGWGS